MKKLFPLAALALLLGSAPARASGPYVAAGGGAFSVGWARSYRVNYVYPGAVDPTLGVAPHFYAAPALPYVVQPRPFVLVPRYYYPAAPAVSAPVGAEFAPSSEMAAHVRALKVLLDQETRIRALEAKSAEPPAAVPLASPRKMPVGEKLEVKEEKK